MLGASGCICFERPGDAHYWFALSTGIYDCLWFSFGFAVSFAVRMLSERHVGCYPDHVELAGTKPSRVVLGPTGALTWDT
jgi:hypothetical protein